MGSSVISKPVPTHLRRHRGIHRLRCSLRDPPRHQTILTSVLPTEANRNQARLPARAVHLAPPPKRQTCNYVLRLLRAASHPTRIHANSHPAICVANGPRSSLPLFSFFLSPAPPRPSLQTRTARRRPIRLAPPSSLHCTGAEQACSWDGGKGVTPKGRGSRGTLPTPQGKKNERLAIS